MNRTNSALLKNENEKNETYTLQSLDTYVSKNKKYTIEKLKEKANEIRQDCIRMIWAAKSGHPSASLSIADIMSTLYFNVLKINPMDPRWIERDRFILSKGHGCPALYAALARRGYFNYDELSTLRAIDSRIQGHPDMNKTPGVDMSTGSLGIGLSVAVGKALAARLLGTMYFVYVLMGDGEMDEGEIWEAAMTASHYKLDNIIGIIDRNNGQADGKTEEIMSLEPLADKWRSFGWYVIEINGHSIEQILLALNLAKKILDKPKLIICHTVKGKGVSFLEGKRELYGEDITEEQVETALQELNQSFFTAGEKERYYETND